MKRTIVERSVFVVVSCVALAAALFLNSLRVPVMRLPAEVEAMVGQEASVAFTAFFTDFQEWYNDHPVTDEGVQLTKENDYQALGDMLMGMNAYWEACAQLDGEIADQMQVFNQPILIVFMLTLNMMMPLETADSFVIAAEEWEAIGGYVNDVITAYQAQ